ncbi:MAG: hydrogen gas-evolving membrane-bound hydrogenase subunit E [Trueperaceae bacterium]|nr:hydrogen gas-evolving membrane-bound hydrogenase subunit E [Trueperaceae bacterium]
MRLAQWQTRVLQSNDLRHYLTIILSFAFGLTALTLAVKGGLRIAPPFTGGTVYEYLFLLITVVAALAVVRAHSRLEAITALGVVGFGIAFVFVLFAAPDLAITQFLVETLVVIIVALVLVRLPHALLREPVRDGVRALAGVVAVTGGILLTTLMLAVLSTPFDPTLTTYFEQQSYPAAHGRNIVNVILVDFRALDTLGEITVLAVAATGVFSLLQRARSRPHPDAPSAAPGPFRSLASSRAAAAPMPAGRRDPDGDAGDGEGPGDPSERSDPPEEGGTP